MNRDQEWADALFRAHQASVRAYLVRRLPEEADDLLAEVFLTAWRNRDRIPDDPLPWLYRTAANHLLHARRDFARTQRRQVGSASQRAAVGAESGDPADALVGRIDDAARVRRAIVRLTDADAELIRLWAWEQLEPREIAFVLGCTSAAARVRLHRARSRIAGLLEAADDLADQPLGPSIPTATAARLTPQEDRT